MGSDSNTMFVWLLYLATSCSFYAIFWIVTASVSGKFWTYVLRAFLAAIIFTPWFVNTQEGTLAPALMVMALDMITIGVSATPRAGVPLVLCIIVAEFISIGFYFSKKNKKSK